MRSPKPHTSSETSHDPFLKVENVSEKEFLTSANHSAKLKPAREKIPLSENKVIKFLKQVFIFFPGTFLLFFMSFGAVVLFLEIGVFRKEIQTLPETFSFHLFLIGLVILLGSLMTWFGLGDLKNRKHFVIPASLIVTGAVMGVFIKVTANFSELAYRLLNDGNYRIYLLPLALIIPILAKGIVDLKTEDNSDEG